MRGVPRNICLNKNFKVNVSGRGSVWLERSVRDAEVTGSSPVAPTKKMKKQSLQIKYSLFHDLMNSIPDVIYFKDTKGKLILVNQAHARGLGLTPDEVAGKTDFDFFPKDRARLMEKDDLQVLKTGKPIVDKVERATRPDGIDNYVSTTKIPRFDNKGKIIGLIGITRDITRRMQLERLNHEKQQIEKKLQSLEEINRLKSDFVSIVSHELRTPLAIVKEAVLLLSDGIPGPLNEQQHQLLLKANQHINNLKGIIDDLLDISRIESGKLKLHYSLVNLNDLLKDTSGFFKEQALQKNIELDYSLPKEEINLFLDAEKINRVLINLLTNAIKFTEANGKIKLEVRALMDRVRIAVIDTGIGIAKADLEKLFNKFMQVSGKANLEKQGLGLGLSIAKGIIQKHSGEVWVESKLGVGSKFYFTLPRQDTIKILDSETRLLINNLIERDIESYLVHLLVINYRSLKKNMKVSPEELFEGLKIIIEAVDKEFIRKNREKPKIVSLDLQNGETSIIFPELGEKEAGLLCDLLKIKLGEYFLKVKAENVFINIGMLPYPQEGIKSVEQLPACLRVKKIYIGQEIRHFRRFIYKLEIKIAAAENQHYLGQTVDISEGGICFISEKLFKTDALVNISLKLEKSDKPLHLRGRVAWIKDIVENKYKTGIEFISLKNKDHRILTKFIKSLTDN